MAAAKKKKAPTKKKKEYSSTKCDEEVSRCIIQLLLKEPFFGHLLAGVVRHYTRSIATAGVGVKDGRIFMVVNPDFFLGTLKKKSERVAVIKHETLHLMFKHVLRMADRNEHNQRLVNLAADLVVNQFIGKWSLPDDAITRSTFPDLKLAPDQTMEHYYERLSSLVDEMRKEGFKGFPKPGSGPGPSSGSAQSPAGTSTPSNKKNDNQRSAPSDYANTSAPESAKVLSRLGPVWHSDHSGWGSDEGDPGNAAADAVLDGLLSRTADRVGSKEWGSLPGPLKALVAAALERRKPQVDWRRAVRIFSNSARRTRIIATNRRQSRRYGTFPGIRVKRLQRLAVVVDTSGSVSDEELSVFFAEIHAMWRAGAEVHVIECDAAVQNTYLYRGRLPTGIGGRGGTVFDPAFKFLRSNRQQIWDGCIYLTDGYASAPTIRPPCKLLWIITRNGKTGEHLRFGRAVQLK